MTDQHPSQNVPGTGMSEQQIKTNRLKLIGIFAVALVPVVLATSMYFAGFGAPNAKTNKGDLLWPPLVVDQLGTGVKSLKQTINDEPNWYLVLTSEQSCVDECSGEALHMMRQVNVAMGREMERVSRAVVTPNIESATSLIEEYPNLKVAQAGSEDVTTMIKNARAVSAAEADSSPWNIWLVDPLGNIILRYGPSHDGYDIKADLKKLLKLSNIG